MPPKTTAINESLDAASVKFILSAIKACSEFTPDWNAVAKENDIKYGKNARSRFNTIVSKFGFKLEDKKVVQIEQEGNEAGDATAVKPKKTAMSPRLPKRRFAQTKSPKKKLKIEPEEEGDEDATQANDEFEDDANEDSSGTATTVS